ncbi:YceI family protein [Actinomadura sp. HBU206391]|uniref:YceI family protein n=1 Tax=Actinomadura sp. HBU206391 TaxID=2731692 RepID=UPI00164EE8EA|nr:YceI family protein [Actinomadura sp. HBU206391]MBC6462962.1 YceI family protein [Actinomadura sp. HBU206391]
MTADLVEIPGYVEGAWAIDPVHSEVGFAVRHLMISKIRGRFTAFAGQIVTAADPLLSSVTATIDLTSVDTANAQRDDHIRSADFFEVDRYPTMTYRSSGLRRDGDGFVLDGELTLKGVTRPVPLRLQANGFGPDPFAADPFAGARAGFTATGEIDRMDFGVTYNGPIPGGGMALGDKVQIYLEIEAVLQVPGDS